MAGWLFTASRLVSRNAQRREMRRKKVEAAAALEMEKITPGGVWTQIDPHLNEALAALPGTDRQAAPEACRQSALKAFNGITKEYLAANPHMEPLHKGVHAAMQANRYKTAIVVLAMLGAFLGK